MHPGGGTRCIKLMQSASKLVTDNWKTSFALQQFLPVWWNPMQTRGSAPTDGVFWPEIAILLHSEKTWGYKTDLTWGDLNTESFEVSYILCTIEAHLMHLLVKMDSIIGYRLDKLLLSCNSPSIKCFLDRIMVFLPSIYIITHMELQIPTNHKSKSVSCVW